MSKIKVVHVGDKFGIRGASVHGVTRLFSWWIPRFDKAKFEVNLVGFTKGDDSGTQYLIEQGIDVISLGKHKFDPTLILALWKTLKAMKPDVLHLHGYGASSFGRMISAVASIPSIVHEHFVDPSYPLSQRPFDISLSNVSRLNIAASKSVRDFMVNKRGFPKDTVNVLYNGSDLAQFTPISAEKIIHEKKKLNIPLENCPVFGTIGRLDEPKGYPYLIEAFKLIVDQLGECRLIILGNGDLMEELKEKAHKLNLSEKIIFAGFRPDTEVVQSLFDIQIFSSIREGSPLTLFEALAMGRAIVSTSAGGLGELLTHEDTALVVDPADPPALAEQTVRLLKDEPLQKRLKKRASKYGKEFDINAMVKKMEEFYTQLAEKK